MNPPLPGEGGAVIVRACPASAPCGRGGIGRRTGFRFQRLRSWGFKSLRPHHAPVVLFRAVGTGRLSRNGHSTLMQITETNAERLKREFKVVVESGDIERKGQYKLTA